METTLDPAVLSRIVRRRAGREPDRVVVVFENGSRPVERVTVSDLAVHGNQVAAVLAGLGLAPGTPIALLAGNSPELLYTMVAASQLALVPHLEDTRVRRRAEGRNEQPRLRQVRDRLPRVRCLGTGEDLTDERPQ
jgi:acyl-CoA synthetase (AMP-forming)/AMP-acid ligase II